MNHVFSTISTGHYNCRRPDKVIVAGHMSILLNVKHGVSISKQSLHERFNEFSVKFLKQALEKLGILHITLDTLQQVSIFQKNNFPIQHIYP